MAHSSGTVIESQVDWLTISAHGELKASRLVDLAQYLLPEQRKRGNKVRAWRLMGYEGTHCGALEFGVRGTDHTEMRLIGDLANERLVQALSLADRVTRLDIAVTWRAEPPDPLLGNNAWSLAEAFHKAHPRSALPSRNQDGDGGQTVYIGKRGSENVLRIYNKEAEALSKGTPDEQERYKACWRYELETKGTVADRLSAVVNDSGDRSEYIQGYVYEWSRKHGVEPAFPAVGGIRIVPGFRRRADEDSRLRHLARNVKPTLDWFRSEGKLDLARKALGLE